MKFVVSIACALIASPALSATLINKSFVLQDASLNYVNISGGKNTIAGYEIAAFASGEWCTNTYTMPGEKLRCEGPDSASQSWYCSDAKCDRYYGGAHPTLESPKIVFTKDFMRARVASFEGYTQYESDGARYYYRFEPTTVWVSLLLKEGVDPNSIKIELAYIRALPAVPEPLTWVSMVLGLAVVGAAVRRQRDSAAI